MIDPADIDDATEESIADDDDDELTDEEVEELYLYLFDPEGDEGTDIADYVAVVPTP